jgi:hypothetical protein
MIILFTLILYCSSITGSQPPAPADDPQYAVNFMWQKNSCYISTALQALIALPTWREYIFSYPPYTSCSYDKELLETLQKFITDYTQKSITREQQISLNPLYGVVGKKGIVTHCGFGDPRWFLDDFNNKLTKNDHCALLKPCQFVATKLVYLGKRPQKITHQEPQTHISIPEHYLGSDKQESLLNALVQYFNEGAQGIGARFTSLPDIFYINFVQQVEFGKDYSIKLPEQLNISVLCEPPQQFTNYQLKSVIWHSSAHYIAYVNYHDIWYLCDDLKSACSIPDDAISDLTNGKLTYGTWGVFYPTICFYERILSASEPTPTLLDLHASLQLLSI